MIFKKNIKKPHWKRFLAWVLSFSSVLLLLFFMVFMGNSGVNKKQSLTVRRVEIALPPPPEPPPPLEAQETEVDADSPTIDLVGAGEGPSLTYSDNPELSMAKLQKIKDPDFDVKLLDFNKTLSVSFPVVEVKDLDEIPRLVSNNRISFPDELSDRGIKRVETRVDIIIDQNGRAFVKKIVDPVYPEMITVIRKAINNSRFTIPKKNGRPVQASYSYTLLFINRV